jgi:hypothetical protein
MLRGANISDATLQSNASAPVAIPVCTEEDLILEQQLGRRSTLTPGTASPAIDSRHGLRPLAGDSTNGVDAQEGIPQLRWLESGKRATGRLAIATNAGRCVCKVPSVTAGRQKWNSVETASSSRCQPIRALLVIAGM